MSNYITIIEQAIIFFPIIAFLISIPFVLIEYHKFGSISILKTLIIYSLILYLICAYFLIVLPLPSFDEVAKLTTPRLQLIPLRFIYDFITHTSLNILNPKTYLQAITQSYFYVPIYNLLLTLPFGVYLRYYFECDFKHTVLYSFLLSLFFELTQLSGLYFIYARSYRLFDVDDLLLNTLGGMLGYLLIGTIIKHLPKKEEIEEQALKKGTKVSGLKRSTSFILDLIIYGLLVLLGNFIFKDFKIIYLSSIILVIYYVILPFILKGSTLGQKFLNLKINDYKDKNNIGKLFLRILFFILSYFAIPFGILALTYNMKSFGFDHKVTIMISVVLLGVVALIYIITFIKYLFTSSPMLYEKLSKTKMVSTIKC